MEDLREDRSWDPEAAIEDPRLLWVTEGVKSAEGSDKETSLLEPGKGEE